MNKLISIILPILILATACANGMPSRQANVRYPHSYAFYDLALSWETKRNDTSVTIEGIVKNISYYYLRDLEISATLLDSKGKSISKETFFVIPSLLSLDQTESFRFHLPVKPGLHPEKLRIFYRYRLAEEGLRGSPHFYSFEVPL